MYGIDFHLVGAIVWFEFGHWWNGIWYCEGWTGSLYIDEVPECFAAGTPVLTRDGSKPIEQLTAGDCILSSPANEPGASPVPNRVKGVIRNRARVLEITVDGQTVQATHKHPFYAKGRAWTPAASLTVGDLLRSRDNRWLPVESIVDGGECPVYNLRVEENSTYFVGGDDWGFSLWVYGACSKSQASTKEVVRARHDTTPPHAWQRQGQR